MVYEFIKDVDEYIVEEPKIQPVIGRKHKKNPLVPAKLEPNVVKKTRHHKKTGINRKAKLGFIPLKQNFGRSYRFNPFVQRHHMLLNKWN